MRIQVILLFVALAGCGREPITYAIPPQHAPVQGDEPVDYGEYVRMSSERPEAYFVQHVLRREGEDWRWTQEEPVLRFFVRSVENRSFRMDWRLHPQTFAGTGPVTLEFYVNDHLLATERYDQPGKYRFEKPVPAQWLLANAPNLIRIKVLNPWQTSEPGLLYGIVLHEAGFVTR